MYKLPEPITVVGICSDHLRMLVIQKIVELERRLQENRDAMISDTYLVMLEV